MLRYQSTEINKNQTQNEKFDLCQIDFGPCRVLDRNVSKNKKGSQILDSYGSSNFQAQMILQ